VTISGLLRFNFFKSKASNLFELIIGMTI